MLSFKQFKPQYVERKVQDEVSVYAFEEADFFNLGSLNEASETAHVIHWNLPHSDKIPSHVHKLKDVPNPEPAKEASPWKHMRHGAQEYFHTKPEEQELLRRESDGINKQKLFTDEAANPKLAKNGEVMPKYHTKGLFLAPSTMSGVDVCPAASKECAAACLGASSGRAHMAPVRKSRIQRTHFMLKNPKHFYAKLDREIDAAKKSAHKNGQKLAVRLNGTSDIPHEHIAPELFKKHHDVQFYDYTKIAGRPHHKEMPKNYHLTVSSTGLNHHDSNWKQVRKHLDKGGVASMVFKVKTGIKGVREAGGLPTHVHDEETGKRYRVIDGDEHDHRHLDHAYNNIPEGEGVIAGLRMKGGPKNTARAGKFAVDVNEHNYAMAKKGEN